MIKTIIICAIVATSVLALHRRAVAADVRRISELGLPNVRSSVETQLGFLGASFPIEPILTRPPIAPHDDGKVWDPRWPHLPRIGRDPFPRLPSDDILPKWPNLQPIPKPRFMLETRLNVSAGAILFGIKHALGEWDLNRGEDEWLDGYHSRSAGSHANGSARAVCFHVDCTDGVHGLSGWTGMVRQTASEAQRDANAHNRRFGACHATVVLYEGK